MKFQAESRRNGQILVLISGNGSNLQQLIDTQKSDEGLGGDLAAVISNQPDAYGLKRAQQAGIATQVLSAQNFTSREAYDQQLIRLIDEYQPDLVVLAGFMRILTPAFVRHYAGRLLNVHPSLLPAYKGLHTHRRVLEAGETEHGVSIHFVTEELDGGPVVLQARVAVATDETEASLAHKVRLKEHLLYPIAVRWFMQGRLQLKNGRPHLDGTPLPAKGLLYPDS